MLTQGLMEKFADFDWEEPSEEWDNSSTTGSESAMSTDRYVLAWLK